MNYNIYLLTYAFRPTYYQGAQIMWQVLTGIVQSCPWVGLTHGLGWVKIFPIVVGWVGLGQTKWTHGQLWDS